LKKNGSDPLIFHLFSFALTAVLDAAEPLGCRILIGIAGEFGIDRKWGPF
jgi:hypothetical protein